MITETEIIGPMSWGLSSTMMHVCNVPSCSRIVLVGVELVYILCLRRRLRYWLMCSVNRMWIPQRHSSRKRVTSALLIGERALKGLGCDAVIEKSSQMFYVYRKHCTKTSISEQLILPESYKLLPVMILGLVNSAALRRTSGSVQSGDAVKTDERAAALLFLIRATVGDIAVICYRR